MHGMKTTHMCCAFFYDITQIFYIVLAGQEKQIIEADESELKVSGRYIIYTAA